MSIDRMPGVALCVEHVFGVLLTVVSLVLVLPVALLAFAELVLFVVLPVLAELVMLVAFLPVVQVLNPLLPD